MFLNFWALVFKMYIFEVMTYFVVEWLSNHLNFSVSVRIYKIYVFGEAFLLLTINAFEHQTFQGARSSHPQIYITPRRSGPKRDP